MTGILRTVKVWIIEEYRSQEITENVHMWVLIENDEGKANVKICIQVFSGRPLIVHMGKEIVWQRLENFATFRLVR